MNVNVADTANIFQTVQQLIQHYHPGGATLTVMEEGIKREEAWWYVPVQPNTEPPKRYEYYEALAEVEQRLLTEQDLNVLLIPVLASEKDAV